MAPRAPPTPSHLGNGETGRGMLPPQLEALPSVTMATLAGLWPRLPTDLSHPPRPVCPEDTLDGGTWQGGPCVTARGQAPHGTPCPHGGLLFGNRVWNLGHLSPLSTASSSIFHLSRSSGFQVETMSKVSYFILQDWVTAEKASSFNQQHLEHAPSPSQLSQG